MPVQFYTGAFEYERDLDLSLTSAKFRVLTDVPDNPPTVLGGAYAGCIGTVLPRGCGTCGSFEPRHFLWTGLETAADLPQQHKVPVNLLTNISTCYAALAVVGVQRCITYKGESYRNIQRIA